eukprot:COSAG06_NODE_1246_length_10113_cov_21.479629_12_plen_120_part_00
MMRATCLPVLLFPLPLGMRQNAQHALVSLLTVLKTARTSPRTHHRNLGLDIRVIFEEGRENAKFSRHVTTRTFNCEPRPEKVSSPLDGVRPARPNTCSQNWVFITQLHNYKLHLLLIKL